MADSGCEDTVPTVSTMVPACKLPEESDASMRARLFTSLSQSFPHSQLYKALHGGEDINLNAGDNSEDDDDSLYGDHLSNSCFASLRMDRRDSDDYDDDLRSLEWLQNEDLLKNIGGEKLDKEDDDSEEQKENEDIKPDINLLQGASGQQAANLSYLPHKHINSKPPYSFSCLIFMAVEASPEKRLPVKDIYNWILTQFPYFQNAPTGWKNSVRHNLSLNKCFKKVEKDKGQSIGKGSLWCIDPAYRPNLLQALRKTPYHPYHQLQMTSTQPQNYFQCHTLPGFGRTVLPLTQRPVPNTVSPHLFPFLSRRLAQTSFDVDNEMKDVAQTLVALKSSYKKESSDSSSGEDTGLTWRHYKKFVRRRPSSPVVVTDHPYEDHAYSSTRMLEDDAPSPSSSSSIDEEYDFGDADEECDSEYQSDMDWISDDKDDVDGDLPNSKKLRIDMQEENETAATVEENEEDEQKKLHEGASALLNLAGLLLNRHSNISPSPDAAVDGSFQDIHNEQEQVEEQKKKISKKTKDVKKSPVVCQKQEDMEQRKRSVSKRKNAGSNGKYNSGEYSLVKPGKAAAKSKSNTGLQNEVNSESPKSTGDEDSEKASGSTAKSKPVQSNANKQTVKEGSIGRRKLKLSKTFGSSTKNVTSVATKNSTEGKTFKNHAHSSKSKKNLPKKGTSKSLQPLVLKKAKASSESCSKLASTSESVHVKSESSQLTSSSDSTNNNVSIKSEVIDEEFASLYERQLDGVSHTGDEKKNRGVRPGNKLQSSAVFSHVNGDTISPAGDAPTKLRAKSSPIKEENIFESKPAHSSPKVSSSRGSSGDAVKSHGSKSSPNVSHSPPSAALHKSPHFTRFSKKKAALS